MSADRAVMQQALYALDVSQALLEKSNHHKTILTAYEALRQALADHIAGARKLVEAPAVVALKDVGYFYNLVMHALMDVGAGHGGCERRLTYIANEMEALMHAAPQPAAPVAPGWKLVPMTPTFEMLDAANAAHTGYSYPQDMVEGPRAMRKAEYRAMMAAAPRAPVADSDPSAPWLALAHTICAEAGVYPGNIMYRLEALRERLRAPIAQPLSDDQIIDIIDGVKKQWNDAADEENQWSTLGYDEIILMSARALERYIKGEVKS